MTTAPDDTAEILAKIDDAQAVIWDRVLDGDIQATNTFLNWQRLRHAVLGIAE